MEIIHAKTLKYGIFLTLEFLKRSLAWMVNMAALKYLANEYRKSENFCHEKNFGHHLQQRK